jgi:hypothetical protein
VEIHSLSDLHGVIERDLAEERQLKSTGSLAHHSDAHSVVRGYRVGGRVFQPSGRARGRSLSGARAPAKGARECNACAC